MLPKYPACLLPSPPNLRVTAPLAFLGEPLLSALTMRRDTVGPLPTTAPCPMTSHRTRGSLRPEITWLQARQLLRAGGEGGSSLSSVGSQSWGDPTRVLPAARLAEEKAHMVTEAGTRGMERRALRPACPPTPAASLWLGEERSQTPPVPSFSQLCSGITTCH